MNNTKCPACGIGNSSNAANCLMCGCELTAQNSPAAVATHIAENLPTDVKKPVFQGSAAPAVRAAPNAFAPPFAPSPQTHFNYQVPPNGANQSGVYGQTQYRPAYRQNYAPQNQKIGLAIASLIFGGLSFLTALFLVGLVLAPIGLILGIIALVKAKKRPYVYGGKGMAIAGVVMSALVFLILPIILAIAIPNLLASRRAANESSAIATMKTLAQAEDEVLANSNICADLPELVEKKFLNSSYASSTRSGYRFTISNLPTKGCEIHAVPTHSTGVSATGSRSFFYSTEDKVLRAAPKQGKMADKTDLPLGESNAYSQNENSGGWFEEPPNVERATRNLRTLHGAAVTYQATVGAGKCGTLADLEKAQLISPALGDGVDAGYRYNLTAECEVSATPLKSGGRTLKIDKFGNIN